VSSRRCPRAGASIFGTSSVDRNLEGSPCSERAVEEAIELSAALRSEIRFLHVVDQILDVLMRDFAEFALQLRNKQGSTPEQMRLCRAMLKKPAADQRRTDVVWTNHVLALDHAYEMNA
jgi:nucleotide-binding universal stress UspA family protein